MPKREGEIYHIISMEWYQRWKKYVSYEHVDGMLRDDMSTDNSSTKKVENEIEEEDEL